MSIRGQAIARGALRMSLGFVFGFAGVVKLRATNKTREAFTHFGIPHAAAVPLSLGVPALEVLVGIGFFTRRFWAPSAVLSSLMLAAFSTAVLKRIVAGKDATCPCFGQHFESVTGVVSLRRNLVFSLSTSYLGATAVGPTAWLTGGFALALAVAGEMAQKSQAAKLPSPLEPGVIVPDIQLQDVGQEPTQLSHLLNPSGLTALLFVNPGCKPCEGILDYLSRSGIERQSEHVRFLLISQETGDSSVQSWLSRFSWATCAFEKQQDAGSIFGVYATPTLSLIDKDRRVVHPRFSGFNEVRKYIDDLVFV